MGQLDSFRVKETGVENLYLNTQYFWVEQILRPRPIPSRQDIEPPR